jgi:hypothetical protein
MIGTDNLLTGQHTLYMLAALACRTYFMRSALGIQSNAPFTPVEAEVPLASSPDVERC